MELKSQKSFLLRAANITFSNFAPPKINRFVETALCTVLIDSLINEVFRSQRFWEVVFLSSLLSTCRQGFFFYTESGGEQVVASPTFQRRADVDCNQVPEAHGPGLGLGILQVYSTARNPGGHVSEQWRIRIWQVTEKCRFCYPPDPPGSRARQARAWRLTRLRYPCFLVRGVVWAGAESGERVLYLDKNPDWREDIYSTLEFWFRASRVMSHKCCVVKLNIARRRVKGWGGPGMGGGGCRSVFVYVSSYALLFEDSTP